VSHTENFIAVDPSVLEPLIRAHRLAEEATTEPTEGLGPRALDPRSQEASTLRTAIENVRLPSNKRKREQAEKRLASFEGSEAWPGLLQRARLAVDPRAELLAMIGRGELPSDTDLEHLFERGRTDLREPFAWTAWVADAERREIASESETYPYVTGKGTTPSIDSMLFGTAEILVDDKPISAYHIGSRGPDRQPRAHAGERAGVVADFYARIADEEGPPLEIFSRWYRQLHADRFVLTTEAVVPKGDELAADYANFLRQVKRFAKRASSFYRTAHRRGWSVLVYIE
jgi:hypothetical protein